MPPLDRGTLYPNQIEAVTNLELSLRHNRPRALIQMATGSGKTFTAVNASYRLLKFGGANRILFLVDRGNLGKQTEDEFADFTPPDDTRKFPTLYTVQRLKNNSINPAAKVVITTIQRLYSMLKGDTEYDEANEEGSAFDTAKPWKGDPPNVVYNCGIPPEFFDFIIVDECHRSIYELWAQVLLYFDSFLIGLTATPAGRTIGFFNKNLVMQYGHDEAVAFRDVEPFDHARDLDQIGRVASVQRQVIDGLCQRNSAQRRVLGLQLRGLGRHFNRFRNCARNEHEVRDKPLLNVEADAFLPCRGEPRNLGPDLVLQLCAAGQARLGGDTRAVLEKYVEDNDAELWIEHDVATHAALPKSPAYVD